MSVDSGGNCNAMQHAGVVNGDREEKKCRFFVRRFVRWLNLRVISTHNKSNLNRKLN